MNYLICKVGLIFFFLFYIINFFYFCRKFICMNVRLIREVSIEKEIIR